MPDEKKLIIDEDWKSQVEAEKEAAKQPPVRKSATGSGPSAPPGDSDDFEMPPASLEMLVSTLVTETMIALGQIPHPATGKTEHRPNQAKYLIDTIAVLSEKTKGNVSAEEEQAFTNLLHQLRMAFVALTERTRSLLGRIWRGTLARLPFSSVVPPLGSQTVVKKYRAQLDDSLGIPSRKS